MADGVSTGKKVVSRTLCIVFVVVALLIGGALGYVYGTNQATTDVEKKLQEKIDSLESELSAAKATAGSEIQEGQANVAEGQQNLEELQEENAELEETVDELNDRIEDLEQQLEDAENANTNTQQ